ncbi:MAG: acyl-ACP--UDP-N-acetylglucosamine O-acyltransferase [Rhodobacteraceae bacterium]|nr:acyl-ACP--UDP-N-acetylglucosamine O-acyltransferase [Paracoccaceae bacterium]
MSISSSAEIHPAAVIESGAEIGNGCRIEAFAVIGPEVVLAERVHVKSHAVVTGSTSIGSETVVFPYACVGEVPQDLKYAGEKTRLEVGKRNRIREGVTMNVGTKHGGGITRVGSDCLFMTGAHVGHDAQVGNHVIMANQAALGGHVEIGDYVIIGGLAGIHQFVRIGTGAIVGALTMVRRDVIPYGQVEGPIGTMRGTNLIGMRRRGFRGRDVSALQKVYQKLANHDGPLEEAIELLAVQESDRNKLIQDVVDFVRSSSRRQLLALR